jgi:hypothetical protein
MAGAHALARRAFGISMTLLDQHYSRPLRPAGRLYDTRWPEVTLTRQDRVSLDRNQTERINMKTPDELFSKSSGLSIEL